jgi:hypothetical protein
LWERSEEFLNSCKNGRRSIAEFFQILSHKPIKLKQGLIDFWVPAYLLVRQEDFALFEEDRFIPRHSSDYFDRVIKNPERFFIKAFDVKGVKLELFNRMRDMLNQETVERASQQGLIQTIRPFLAFYRDLPEYSKVTKRLGKEALAIREAITLSKDPEKTFFEDFPVSLGYSLEQIQNSDITLREYIESLQAAIRELRTSFDELINRFEEFILSEIIGETLPFKAYKAKLQLRFSGIKKHLCLPHQRTFLQRLSSEIDDRIAWLSSIGQVVIGTPLESLKDREEIFFFDKFKSLVHELDNLSEISEVEFNEDKEDAISIELGSFGEGVQKSIIRLPKTRNSEIEKLEAYIKEKLSKDSAVNLAALANILKELLKG